MILSIIVPVYQAKNTLCRCADSILSKRDIEFELILVNDGSTDGSRELCERYAQQDSRVLAVTSQTEAFPRPATVASWRQKGNTSCL